MRQVDRSKDSLFFPTGQSLAYLDGSLPADFGFDPLGLLDPESKGVGFINPEWLRYACALPAAPGCRLAFFPATAHALSLQGAKLEVN